MGIWEIMQMWGCIILWFQRCFKELFFPQLLHLCDLMGTDTYLGISIFRANLENKFFFPVITYCKPGFRERFHQCCCTVKGPVSAWRPLSQSGNLFQSFQNRNVSDFIPILFCWITLKEASLGLKQSVSFSCWLLIRIYAQMLSSLVLQLAAHVLSSIPRW